MCFNCQHVVWNYQFFKKILIICGQVLRNSWINLSLIIREFVKKIIFVDIEGLM